MTLNSSGPISLGGTTAGQSIEIENGGTGTTTISLNDTAVRTLAGVASGTIVMPTNFYGKSNAITVSSWLAYTAGGNTGGNFYLYQSQSKGSTIVYGNVTNDYFSLINRNLSTGVFNWGQTLQSLYAYNIFTTQRVTSIDSSGNIYYVVLPFDSSGQTTVSATLVKTNSSGTLQFKNKIASGVLGVACSNMFVDSSDNLYLGVNVGVSYKLLKLSSGGTTIAAEKNIGGDIRGSGIFSTGDIVTFQHIFSGGVDRYYLYIYNSALTTNTIRKQLNFTINCGCVGPSNTIFVGGNNTVGAGGSTSAYLTKLNTDGTVAWSLSCTPTGTAVGENTVNSVVTDSDGNSYWGCYIVKPSAVSSTPSIIKVDPNGTVLWVRSITNNTSNTGECIVTLLPTIPATFNAVFLGGGASTSTNSLNAPTDGTKTGAYTLNGTTFTYAAESYSFVTGVATSTTVTVSNPGTGTTLSLTADSLMSQITFAPTYNSVTTI